MERKILTDEEYKERMLDIGFTYDELLDKFFWYDWVFWYNVDDDVKNVYDLITFNENGYPTYMATVLNDLMYRGAKFVVCQGAIDEYGQKCKKALYCINYNKLYSKDNKIKRR